MTQHTPKDIALNSIKIQLDRAEELMDKVYYGDIKGFILYGPPGIGKTHLGEKVAKKHGQPWRPQFPRTHIGLIKVLSQNRSKKAVNFDDIDGFWDDPPSMGTMKTVLDNRQRRFLAHTVGGSAKGLSIPRFELLNGVMCFSNRDFNNPKQFKCSVEDLMAVKTERAITLGLSFDPLEAYEYTGWLATEQNMLKRCFSKQYGRNINLEEANDVLAHLAHNATRYPSISPRMIVKFAGLRIGEDKKRWEGWVEEQLHTDNQVKFVRDGSPVGPLHVFQIRPRTTNVVTEPPEAQREPPAAPPAPVAFPKAEVAPPKTPPRPRPIMGEPKKKRGRPPGVKNKPKGGK